MTLEEQIRQQFGQYGDWNAAGVDRAQELANLLRQGGVDALGDLSLVDSTDVLNYAGSWSGNDGNSWDPGGQETIYGKRLKIGDKDVGFLGDYNLDGTYGSKAAKLLQQGSRLGWSARGDGNVSYEVGTDPNTGKTYIRPTLGSSSDKEKFTKIALAAAVPLGSWALGIGAAGGAGAATGGGLAGSAAPSAGVYGAGLGAETAAGLVAPGAAGSGGAALAAPGAFGAGGLLATGGAAAGSMLPSWLPKALGPAWEFVKDNPKLVGALAGGLLGGVGAQQGGEEPAPYTGPMPTITRGGWQSSASGYKPMQQQSYGGGLLGGQSKPMGGIGRYMGILGG